MVAVNRHCSPEHAPTFSVTGPWMIPVVCAGILLLLVGQSRAEDRPYSIRHYGTVLKGFVDSRGMVDYRGLKNHRGQLDSYVASLGELSEAR